MPLFLIAETLEEDAILAALTSVAMTASFALGPYVDVPAGYAMSGRWMVWFLCRQNCRMKTTIDIPEKELRDAMRFTKAKTKREAVVKVLVDFNRRRRMAELVKYSGTFSDVFPSNDEIEAVDGNRVRRLDGRSRR